ncbi:putative HTH-type transcriptional regulator [Pseudomonas reidholzensis]|uniref:Putative HTH-type transcriptional regulator n=1 Tax=Pseudomonas reidholzensis TaxID=1785162 RepID=A0A383RZM7_9PSED|nr:LysR family transcriptional regulator [Pseudomonas reidholzensis]SYX91926.1 putative HTH-type transcriptional regulator [Pseudomonas reidholzensis]
MDKLRALNYFTKVAQTLSFTEAAAAFDVPASSISRRIAELEKALGAQLLHRTTRTVRLTEAGEVYLQQISLGMAQLEAAEELVRERGNTPSGMLRISCMAGYGRLMLMPVLEDFSERYPDILLDVHLSDELVDLGGDQVDIAIRGGVQPEHRVVARRLDPSRFVLAASPTYLAQRGTPKTLDDLSSHAALLYRGPKSVFKWLGFDGQEWVYPAIDPVFISNDGASLLAMACRHRGMVLLPEWSLRAHLERNALVVVELEQPVAVSRSAQTGIYLLYAQSRYPIPKIRAAVEFIYERLAHPEVK